ncbi:hypothetical protein FB451DRAFT_1375188 [Mycena latifolia]|nr:hypothetical protein FB451DRAFT_1375188 [Mycena latifolia]
MIKAKGAISGGVAGSGSADVDLIQWAAMLSQPVDGRRLWVLNNSGYTMGPHISAQRSVDLEGQSISEFVHPVQPPPLQTVSCPMVLQIQAPWRTTRVSDGMVDACAWSVEREIRIRFKIYIGWFNPLDGSTLPGEERVDVMRDFCHAKLELRVAVACGCRTRRLMHQWSTKNEIGCMGEPINMGEEGSYNGGKDGRDRWRDTTSRPPRIAPNSNKIQTLSRPQGAMDPCHTFGRGAKTELRVTWSGDGLMWWYFAPSPHWRPQNNRRVGGAGRAEVSWVGRGVLERDWGGTGVAVKGDPSRIPIEHAGFGKIFVQLLQITGICATDGEGCFDKARRSFNNRKRIDLIVDNEYNDVYGPEQMTSTVFNRVYGRFGACKPFRTQWEQTQRTV